MSHYHLPRGQKSPFSNYMEQKALAKMTPEERAAHEWGKVVDIRVQKSIPSLLSRRLQRKPERREIWVSS